MEQSNHHPSATTAWTKYLVVAIVLFVAAAALWWRQTNLEQPVSQQGEQLQAELNTVPPRPELSGVAPASTETEYVIGDPETAQLLLIEYIDLNCSFCKQFHGTMQTVTQQYGSQVAWVVRHFPVQGSIQRSAWLECVGDKQGSDAYWQFIAAYYAEVTSTPAARDDALFEDWLAANEYDQLDCDLDSYTAKIAAQHAEGTAAGVVGTPTMVLETASGEREIVMGALTEETLTQLIDSYLPAD